MRIPFIRACALGLTLIMGLGLSSTALAWAAYHNGNYYHGGGYHGAYYGGYHGYGYHGYGWGAPGYVGYGCRYVQTCYPTGCIEQRVCY